MARRLLHFLLTCLGLGSTFVLADDVARFRFDHMISTEEAYTFPLGSFRHTVEDQNGLLWFGSQQGIFRYDGYELKVYNKAMDSADCTNFVTGLVVDSANVVWASSRNGICYYSLEEDRFKSFKPTKWHNESPQVVNAAAIALSPSDEIYVGIENGLLVVARNRNSISLHKPSQLIRSEIANNLFQALMFEDEHRLWIGSERSGLFRFDIATNQYVRFKHNRLDPSGMPSNNILSLTMGPQSKLWIGTADAGLVTMDTKTLALNSDDKYQALRDALPGEIPNILIDSQQQLWIASSQGLYTAALTSGEFTQISPDTSHRDGLASERVVNTYETRHGEILISLYPMGVDRFNKSHNQVKQFKYNAQSESSLNHNDVTALLEYKPNHYVIGTEKGVNLFDLEKLDMKRLWQVTPTQKMPAKLKFATTGYVSSLAAHKNGNVLIGTLEHGLLSYDHDKAWVTQLLKPDLSTADIKRPKIRSLLSVGEKVFIGSENQGLLVLDEDQQLQPFLVSLNGSAQAQDTTNFSGSAILAMQKLSNHLWLGTSNGLIRIDLNTKKYQALSQAHNPVGNTITGRQINNFFLDKDEKLWIATSDRGVFHLNPYTKQFVQMQGIEQLDHKSVTQISQGSDGLFWFFTHSGAIRYNAEQNKSELFHQGHGLSDADFYHGAVDISVSGDVIAGTKNGLNVFDSKGIQITPRTYDVIIGSVTIPSRTDTTTTNTAAGSRVSKESALLTLEALDRTITFEFVALNYEPINLTEYHYKLAGFDQHWSVTSNRYTTYTNLPHGSYTFLVKAQDGDGNWSQNTAELTIDIPPYIWQSFWAFTFYLILGLAILYLLVKTYQRQFKFQQESALNQQLIQLGQQKDAFLANTSHELRTPLNGIIGLAQSLLSPSMQTVERQKRIELIISISRKLSALVNDILDYSKMMDHSLKLHKSNILMKQLIDDVFSICRPLAMDKNIELFADISDAAVSLYADENRLQQILINLVNNGIKYSDGGFVKVYTRKTHDRFIIEVEDSGVGIKPDQLSKLFEPYAQVNEQDSHSTGGTGLGLHVTKTLVKLHDGKIAVISEPNKGSRFIVTLPVDDTGAAQQGSHAALEKLSTPEAVAERFDHTVLIADDDPVSRMVLEEVLQRAGYKTLSAKNGAEAISKFSPSAVDLVILDRIMPEIDGYDACRKLRATFGDAPPIMILSANVTLNDRQTAKEIGANGIYAKPISQTELIHAITELLKKDQ